jgi:type I restriction enzyme R subunit
MQTLARVNRTFRGKADGLLVAYAPLVDNLARALAEYTVQDQASKPIGRDTSEAAALTGELVERLRELLVGYDWKAVLSRGGAKAYLNAATGATNYLRSVGPANDPSLGAETLAGRYRRFSSQLARAWALASGGKNLPELRPEIAFYEEVRVWMAKYDARDRQGRGEPIPEEVQRLLSALVNSAVDAPGVIDIYEAAGMPHPSLADLGPSFVKSVQEAPNPQLAIEALRAMLLEESATAARNNVVRQRAFSERIGELMTKYTNQQLTSAEVIAQLVELAREVSLEASRGSHFTPPLNGDELAFYDAVTQNESAVEVQGEGVLAQIARDLVEVMRRDVRTDWTVRDDVRAKLRASIKRLLVKNGYPPDKQPEAIRLVMDQMETMAPRFAEGRS